MCPFFTLGVYGFLKIYIKIHSYRSVYIRKTKIIKVKSKEQHDNKQANKPKHKRASRQCVYLYIVYVFVYFNDTFS